ncbi:hypothetical protein [Acetanaerobacterium elongatum]|uniref:Uncharacterized protein n=1 Tax=Acetanaerobacterium elongatum TaxID=258515 RepID=A0A1G9Z149_9FIRM|nr:hypothetical protein [Acetanaerobacterium elongatum]SDN14541.1 hypothetical protein SAMN05192585_11239 [Acetanaerobacterium elongatum]
MNYFTDGVCPKCGGQTHGINGPAKCWACGWTESQEDYEAARGSIDKAVSEAAKRVTAKKQKKNSRAWLKFQLTINLRHNLRRLMCLFIIPFGLLRKPRPVEQEEVWLCPVCPHCYEPTYNDRYCVFCGQRFLEGENDA